MEDSVLTVWQSLGEKPKHKRDRNGKMHTLDERETENVSRKPIALHRNAKKNNNQ